MGRHIVIAIDGPVGVGKSTVAKELARRFGFFHLDTGAMYRSVTLSALQRGIDLNDESALSQLAGEIKIDLVYQNDELIVFCDGQDVSQAIRSPEVSASTSPVSDVLGVRKQLVSQQRAIAKKHARVVAEGRDIGTVVFPRTPWKFYLDATLEERAKRRLLQLKLSRPDLQLDIEAIIASTAERDRRDRSRPFGPLRVAKDAIVIDTTHISKERVVSIIASIIQPELQL